MLAAYPPEDTPPLHTAGTYRKMLRRRTLTSSTIAKPPAISVFTHVRTYRYSTLVWCSGHLYTLLLIALLSQVGKAAAALFAWLRNLDRIVVREKIGAVRRKTAMIN
jgi:hypothetical protein